MLSNRFGESIQQRNTSVKGEECDGTLRERVAMATKQGGTAGISIYSLSLILLKASSTRTGFFVDTGENVQMR